MLETSVRLLHPVVKLSSAVESLRTVTSAFSVCIMCLPSFSPCPALNCYKTGINVSRHLWSDYSPMRVNLPSGLTALCICQIAVSAGHLRCGYFTPLVFPRFVDMRHSVWMPAFSCCDVCNTVVICVIPGTYLQIRTQAISPCSSMQTMDLFWNVTDSCWSVARRRRTEINFICSSAYEHTY